MKSFFKNKFNIVLLILLLLIVGAAVFFGIKIFSPKEVYVNAADFSDYSQGEVVSWAETNGLPQDKIVFTYEYNETIPKDKVIYQSVKVGDPITDTLNIVLSNGPDPDREVTLTEDFTNKTKGEALNWFNEKGFINVTTSEEYSDTVEKDCVIGVNVSVTAKISDPIVIRVSLGKKEEKKDDPTEKGIIVPDTYIGLSEANFIAKIEALGLKPVKQSQTYKNTQMTDGTVYAYDSTSDGITFKAGDIVKYYLVKNEGGGEQERVAVPGNLVLKTEADFVNIIKGLGLVPQRSSEVKKTTNPSYDGKVYSYKDSEEDGMIYHKGDTLTYILYSCDEKTIIVPDTYLGMKEADFISKIEGLGLVPSKQSKTYKSSTFGDGTVYAYDSTSDGYNFKKGDTVKYYLVQNEGGGEKERVNVPGTYLGLSEAEFTKKIEALGLFAKKTGEHKTVYKNMDGTIYSYKDSAEDGMIYHKGESVEYVINKYNTEEGGGEKDRVSVPGSYLGLTETEFKKKIEALGLYAEKQAEHQTTNEKMNRTIYSYKDSEEDGMIYHKGETVYYTLNVYNSGSGSSEGGGNAEEETASIANLNVLSAYEKSTFAETKTALASYFSKFKNVTYNGVESTQGVGTIVSIVVDGKKNATGTFPVSTPIVVNICNSQLN